MYKSNQFPRQQDKIKSEPVPINQRAAILLREIIARKNEKNSLYHEIMKPKK